MAEYDKTKYELPSDAADNSKLNKLRAAVLGGNDGIVSISSLMMGVAGATSDTNAIALAGLAALIAGALSMAVGEYVSVSSQSDAEKAYVTLEKEDLHKDPEGELDELAREYRAHLHVHFNLDPDDLNNPWQAAIASFLSFSVGGLVPFLAMILTPSAWRIPVAVAAVVAALLTVGYLSAMVGRAPRVRAITRVVVGGLIAMAVTYGVGVLFGHSV
jgi:VIT1/CCC1 family predicted Fe2+/Mn2+ transporter